MMERLEALHCIAEHCNAWPIVVACAASSREMASLGQKDNHLYLYDQLGMSSSLGLGIALALERSAFEKVVAIEGDGGMLFNLSSLATIGALRPRKLVLIVLDNEAYASTGGQETASRRLDLAGMATAAGIAARQVSTEEDLRDWLDACRSQDGPHFARVHIAPGNAAVPALKSDPALLAHRFSTFLQAGR